MVVRPARLEDAESIARIYNEGIADRTATFETRLRTAEEVRPWLDGLHPVVVVELEHEVIAFAATSAYRLRECYAGIAEASLYVARAARGHGAGRKALNGLIDAAAEAGFWKLVSRVFVENDASRNLCRKLGFREVGVYKKHAKLDGEWRDVIIVERLIAANVR
jgi:phosphinothricin acetyltransferase